MKIKKNFITCIVIILLFANLAIIFNIPLFRQLLGFVLLTIMPGLLIIKLINLNKIDSVSKLLLMICLSASFIMILGIVISCISFFVGYERPLSMTPILISLDCFYIISTTLIYKSKEYSKEINVPRIKLTLLEKVVLCYVVLLPPLSVLGGYLINSYNINAVTITTYLLIIILINLIIIFNGSFPSRIYPITIFLISLSSLLVISMRSNHIIGIDAHKEYFYFMKTLANASIGFSGKSLLDACISISIIPTIYQVILNVQPEKLFKVLYSIIFSITPVLIYVSSRKYVGDFFGFVASCIFIIQYSYLLAPMYIRSNIAVLFIISFIYVLFNNEISIFHKKILMIIFLFSCVISHYTSTYIFLIVLVSTLIGLEIVSFVYKSNIYKNNRILDWSLVVLASIFIFMWYAQVTESPFNFGVKYIENTFLNLNQMFIDDIRSNDMQTLFGKDIQNRSVPNVIEIIANWLIIIYISVGMMLSLIRFREISLPKNGNKKPYMCINNLDIEYHIMAISCFGLLSSAAILPFISTGYGIERLYLVAMCILPIFFILGAVEIAKLVNMIQITNIVPKTSTIIVLIIPISLYFVSISGLTYEFYGIPRTISIDSWGPIYDMQFIHDQDSQGAEWLGAYRRENHLIYTDHYGMYYLISQGKINERIDEYSLLKLLEFNNIDTYGYIYLRYTNSIKNKLIWPNGSYNTSELRISKSGYSKIYNNDINIYISNCVN